jgi:hypothetical protein
VPTVDLLSQSALTAASEPETHPPSEIGSTRSRAVPLRHKTYRVWKVVGEPGKWGDLVSTNDRDPPMPRLSDAFR